MTTSRGVGRPSNDPENEDLDIAEFFAEYGSQGQLKMYRIEGGRQKWVCSLDSVAAMPEEEILEKYGPGRFLIRAKQKGKWIASQVFEIEGTTRLDNTATTISQNPPPEASSLNDRLFMMMQESANKTHETLIALITSMGARGNGSSFDPAALMASMFSGVTAIKQLSDGSGSGKDPLDQVDKILSISERLNGGNNGGSKTMMDHLADVAKDVLPIIMAAKKDSAPERERVHVNPASPTAPFPAVNPPADPQKQLQVEVRVLWNKIVKAADMEMVVENLFATLNDLAELDDRAADAIIGSIENTPTLEEWLKVAGGVEEKHKPWFERFFNAVKAGFSESVAAEIPKETEMVKDGQTSSLDSKG